jgi:23S rRNA (cytidine1920-2'-O)/16S rRNA (cytidine1409-2'-O)-methyltransferase
MKSRLDSYLFENGLFESRALARAAIMEGLVSVDGTHAVKPGTQVSGSEAISVDPMASAYVSRGGLKLEGALEELGIDVRGMDVLDVGASTGGFTDCLLSAGAARVAALDVGKGQLHWRLRNDARVTVIEGCNARYLVPGDLPFSADLSTIDVSFISLEKVLGPVAAALDSHAQIVALVKPQFEAGREQVGRGGVVRDPSVHAGVLRSLAAWLAPEGLSLVGLAASRLRGPKGNIEFFIRIARGGSSTVSGEDIDREVAAAHGMAPLSAGEGSGAPGKR